MACGEFTEAPGFLDHVMIKVSDIDKAKAFWTTTLAPLGFKMGMDLPQFGCCGLAVEGFPELWLGSGEPRTIGMHLAFKARSRDVVDAFYKAALSAGAKDNGAPGVRAHYHPDYYACFVIDPEGHNIECVCRVPEAKA